MLEIFAVPFYSEVLPTTLGQQIIQRKFELEKKKNQGVASFQDFFVVALPVFSSQIAPDAILILVHHQIKPSALHFEISFFMNPNWKLKLENVHCKWLVMPIIFSLSAN